MKLKWIAFFLLVFGVLGYLRERFFEHMNMIMASTYRHVDYYAENHSTMPAVMEPFSHWSYPALYYSKYIFTLIACALFYLLSFFAIKLITGKKDLIKYLNYSYLLLLLLASISMAWAWLVKGKLNEDEYTFSRWILGVAQSPLICLILIASSKLYNSSFQNKTNNL